MFTQLYALGMSTMVENLLGLQTPTQRYIKHIPEDYMGWRVNTPSDNPYMVPCLLIAEIKHTIKFWSIISISIRPTLLNLNPSPQSYGDMIGLQSD